MEKSAEKRAEYIIVFCDLFKWCIIRFSHFAKWLVKFAKNNCELPIFLCKSIIVKTITEFILLHRSRKQYEIRLNYKQKNFLFFEEFFKQFTQKIMNCNAISDGRWIVDICFKIFSLPSVFMIWEFQTIDTGKRKHDVTIIRVPQKKKIASLS